MYGTVHTVLDASYCPLRDVSCCMLARVPFMLARVQYMLARDQFMLARAPFILARVKFMLARVQFMLARVLGLTLWRPWHTRPSAGTL